MVQDRSQSGVCSSFGETENEVHDEDCCKLALLGARRLLARCGRERKRERKRKGERKRERQTDRQTDTNRQRERHRQTERDREREFCFFFGTCKLQVRHSGFVLKLLCADSLDVDSSLRAVLEPPDVPMAQCRSMPVRPLGRVRGSCTTRRRVCVVVRSTGAAECTPPSGVPRDVARRGRISSRISGTSPDPLKKVSTEVQTEEKKLQEQYKEFMIESPEIRTDKVKESTALKDSEGTLESGITDNEKEFQSSQLSATEE